MSMNKHEEEEEVEQLLKQAEDDVFLRLNLNSHTTKQHLHLPSSSLSLPSSSSSSDDPLDDELARRLASLKVTTKNPQTQLPKFRETQSSKLGENQEGFGENPKTRLPKHGENPEEFGAEDGLNYGLLKRFESLKGSMKRVDVEGLINLGGGGGGIGGGGLRSEEDEDFETEVNKLIEWAKDAARLDPSPNEEEEEDDHDGDEEEEEEVGSKKDKGKRVEKGK